MNKNLEQAATEIKELLCDPYPIDIFPEITQSQYLEINEMIKNNFGFTIDRLAAHIGRKVREPLKESVERFIDSYREVH